MFFQNSDDLFFRELAALHVLVLSMGQNELQSGLDRRGNVNTPQLDTQRPFDTQVTAAEEGWMLVDDWPHGGMRRD
jgi:hypothetical protein